MLIANKLKLIKSLFNYKFKYAFTLTDSYSNQCFKFLEGQGLRFSKRL